MLASEQECTRFLLVDGSAHALVDPNAATLLVDRDHTHEVTGTNELEPREHELFARRRIAPNWFTTEHVLIGESVIEIGDTLAVVGSGVREPDPSALPEGLYRAEAVTLIALTGSDAHPLLITDDASAR